MPLSSQSLSPLDHGHLTCVSNLFQTDRAGDLNHAPCGICFLLNNILLLPHRAALCGFLIRTDEKKLVTIYMMTNLKGAEYKFYRVHMKLENRSHLSLGFSRNEMQLKI